MIDIKPYQTLLNEICKIENLNETEIENANKMLSEKVEKISNLRNFIEDNIKEYTDISYFFVVYAIILNNKEENNSFEEFKSGKIFSRIKNIIETQNIKFDLYHFSNLDEYKEKYQNDYDLLINGLNSPKIEKGYKDIAVEMFWNIFEEL